MADPISQLSKRGAVEKKTSARAGLSKAIAARNDGIVSVGNPLLGDRYAYKLN